MKDRYFRSTSFPLVAFLYCNNQQIAGVGPTGKLDQMEFAFVDTTHLQELIDLYRFGPKGDERLLVDVHKYEYARKVLLSLLRD